MHEEEEIHAVLDRASGGTSSLSVLPAKGARLVRLRLAHRGQQYIVLDHHEMEKGSAGERYGGVPLIPFAGRIAGGRYFLTDGRILCPQMTVPAGMPSMDWFAISLSH